MEKLYTKSALINLIKTAEGDLDYILFRLNTLPPSATIIHCKDCKYSEQVTRFYSQCKKLNSFPIVEDDFCSFAEEKKDDE